MGQSFILICCLDSVYIVTLLKEVLLLGTECLVYGVHASSEEKERMGERNQSKQRPPYVLGSGDLSE